ncbi:UspA domain protein [Haloterrigena turkmenica DSM 5511]|uniref:UspA domain protein n=1 Tax=Haloterrigena turkmenica (strain ATCC 51198 / DSM 5511 / JCM 9101 / NCIMB 13204 / VKM B-1734 / 4k) TaxID=543526 RepID=D2RW74_HALTV|nr:universal stress protein [Haloterrigena turkmenica]ADB59463.1 UspA domain protein [Haloterrigena turkmenica DSM 5511]
MTDALLETMLVPIASEDDAKRTCEAILSELNDRATVHVVHVIEKAGGAPDKAGVAQREERAERIFEIVESTLAGTNTALETEILYGTDVAATILEHARDLEATAIVFTPRGASRWMRLLTGDVAQKLLTNTDRPLVILPRSDHE